MTDATHTPPALHVVNADATPEEIAAVVAVFSALGGSADSAPRAPRPEWNAPHRLVRRPVQHGLGGWRSSALPR
ncbi:acyl-CoA carboxylase subunit epsilon [Nocardioides limicola]|uniref:acyl-CoA carboxylase subunit epsilon n=1 Tax=Nocardioides limicola TaxID=2803368 RepID=UPI00193B0260|nr:acyl-CoA carboxylase subunit epsilon [Nocardioides sp. DJM-14]